MKDVVVGISIVLAAIGAVIVHHALSADPIVRLQYQSVFYEEPGISINVPDPEGTVVEVYSQFVLIDRPDGVVTLVPMHRLHAMDGKQF